MDIPLHLVPAPLAVCLALSAPAAHDGNVRGDSNSKAHDGNVRGDSNPKAHDGDVRGDSNPKAHDGNVSSADAGRLTARLL